MKRFVLALALASSFIGAALVSPTGATVQGLPIFREENGFLATVRVEGKNLKIRVLQNSGAYSGVVHAYLISKDLEHYYFEYPEEADKGTYNLAFPPMEAGTYDLILEITGGGGHEHDNPKFVQNYPLNLEIMTADPAIVPLRRLSLKDTVPTIKPAGQASSFELTTLLDGKPVAWNPYYVHQFILKTDWSFFRHSHPKAKELGVGSVRSEYTFPSSGEYVVWQFLETGVKVDGERYRPVLRYPNIISIK